MKGKVESTIEKKEEKIVIDKGIITIKLDKKFKFNDVEIEKVDLDFNSLTGAEICDAESNFRDKYYQPVPNVNYSFAYQAAVAAKASKLPYELILELPVKDFTAIIGAARGFLLG